jgi:hypothetical protein
MISPSRPTSRLARLAPLSHYDFRNLLIISSQEVQITNMDTF